MNAISRGRCRVGGWYIIKTMLEYSKRRTRMPKRIVDTMNERKI